MGSWPPPILPGNLLVVGGGIVLGVSFLVLLSHDTRLIYLAAILFAVGNGLMWPSYMALLSRTGEPRDQGMLQGVAASVGSAASIVGLIARRDRLHRDRRDDVRVFRRHCLCRLPAFSQAHPRLSNPYD